MNDGEITVQVEEGREIAPTVAARLAHPRQSDQMLEMIEHIATSPTFNIEALNAVVALRERLQAGEAKSAFDRDLAAMQPQLPTIDSRGRIIVYSKADRDKAGGPLPTDKPQQTTPYALMADINEAIRPVLGMYGFALSFRVGQAADGKLAVTGILSHRDGHREETTLTLQHDSTGSKNPVQAVGSSLKYGQRYATIMLLNISSRAPQDMDDDGHAAGAENLVNDQQAETLRMGIEANKIPLPRIMAAIGLAENSAIEDIPASEFDRVCGLIKTVIEARAKKASERRDG